MSKRDDLVDFTGDDELLFMDPERFDVAIVGYIEGIGRADVVCYSKSKVLEILMEDGMSWEEAGEYYNFNMVGAYMGEKTPVFLEVI
jgi:hypothetical protein